MPNWCTNTLTIRGDTAAVENFLFLVRGNSAPQWPDCGDTGNRLVREHVISNPINSAFDFHRIKPVPEDIIRRGFSDAGFDWCCTNWGTKWDVGNDIFQLTLTRFKRRAMLKIRMDTAWSPPLGVIARAAEMFPTLSFRISWREEGNGDKGSESFGPNHDGGNSAVVPLANPASPWFDHDQPGLTCRVRCLRDADRLYALVVVHADPTAVWQSGAGLQTEAFGWRVALIDLELPGWKPECQLLNAGPYGSEQRAWEVARQLESIVLSGSVPGAADVPAPSANDLTVAEIEHFRYWEGNPPDSTAHQRMRLRSLMGAGAEVA